MEMFSLNEPFTQEFFCVILAAFLSTFNSDIQKENRRSHVKCKNLFNLKKNEIKQDENETLC